MDEGRVAHAEVRPAIGAGTRGEADGEHREEGGAARHGEEV